MNRIKILTYLLLMIALVWPNAAYARGLADDKVIFGGTYTLAEGETLDGSVVVFGGAITLEANSTVNGDVVLIGGTVDAAGTINGDMVGIGGVLQLSEAAIVNGSLVTIGAALDRAAGAEINGDVVQGVNPPFQFNLPEDAVFTPGASIDRNPALDVVWFFFRMFMWAALAILLVIFFAKPTERVANAALSEPLITAGAGLLTAVLSPLAVLALVVTIILSPVGLVLAVLLALAWLFGWVALGLEVGQRVAKMLNQEWAPAIASGVGTLILYFVLAGFDQIVPCVGGLPRAVVGLWGMGAVMMTYFGTRDYQNVSRIVAAPQVVANVEVRESTPEEDADPLPDDGLTPEE
ncbi:MAG: hypothetical protein H8E28_10605 [Anaerolineae bacterium]|nr:hypothetical protein [Anaerolineae bacterium]MBL6966657.1 hypothetical protein [Anaerolineales bacterium]